MAEEYGSTTGQMFGKPCLKINKKAFAAFYKGQMVFKLGQVEVDLLKTKFVGSENWDPSSKKRPMKDWVLIPEEFSDFWLELAQEAYVFVDTLNR